MANPIKTTGMVTGIISTTHKSGETISAWVSRHTDAVDAGTPGAMLKTTWTCAGGEQAVVTNRNSGETDEDFISRHEIAYALAMVGCPPEP